MARILIVAGGCRGRTLAGRLAADGHAVRMTTRTEAGRSQIERAGAECFIGTPDVVGSLRYALDQVTVLCWLLGTAAGESEAVRALHASRLTMMLSTVVDTTVRGVLYEARGRVAAGVLSEGARLVAQTARARGVPFAILEAEPADRPAWVASAARAIEDLLEPPARPAGSRTAVH